MALLRLYATQARKMRNSPNKKNAIMCSFLAVRRPHKVKAEVRLMNFRNSKRKKTIAAVIVALLVVSMLLSVVVAAFV